MYIYTFEKNRIQKEMEINAAIERTRKNMQKYSNTLKFIKPKNIGHYS